MARLKEISYGRKVSIDFCSRSLILTAEIESEDDVAKVFGELKKAVDEQLNNNSIESNSTEPVTQTTTISTQVSAQSIPEKFVPNYQKDTSPATIPQLNFLKKFGQRNLILIGLSKTEASSLIQKIKSNWKH